MQPKQIEHFFLTNLKPWNAAHKRYAPLHMFSKQGINVFDL